MKKLFIVGIPRSGTTWLFEVLSKHPQIEVVTKYDFNPSYDGPETNETNCFHDYRIGDIKRVYARLSEMYPKKVLLEKTPLHLECVDKIIQTFPDARIVYVQRDPRGQINSALKTKWYKRVDNIYEAISEYKALFNYYLDFKNKMLTIRYEDMVDDIEEVIASILAWVDLENVKLNTEYKGKAFRKGDPQSWKTELSESDIKLIDINCNYIMMNFNYERNS